MNEKPYHNEPGFEQERQPGDCERYNDCIRHETIRVAVCDVLDNVNPIMPSPLREVIKKSFPEFYEYYLSAVTERLHLTGQTMQDPYGEKRGKFQYSTLKTRLEGLKKSLDEEGLDKASDGDCSSSSDNEMDTCASLSVH
ncbi:ubiquitin-conjugating enzyme E2 Z-like [Asterias rubens]|uniref:ubiquitin-conjugating enzyme E2 Z-like n=1 Tax=Asterias rubens TaxID=7604 RepID=UPI00145518A4|nr:ubiquitin-conjugating enzyme E2 Z-like [Asterias rubens]